MKANLSLFTRPLFLFGLILLSSNDFYFKYAFPGVLTGKLSDFAGLFIFPYFFSVFFEKRTKIVYMATALYFTFWKLEISQPYIDWLSSLTHLPFYRTVDVTDLIALLILPFSYQYFRKDTVSTIKANFAINAILLFICCFSFVATTLPHETGKDLNLTSGKTYILPVSKQQILEEYNEPNHIEIGRDVFSVDDFNTIVYAEIEVKEFNKSNTLIILKEISHYVLRGATLLGSNQSNRDAMEKMQLKDFEKYYGDHLTEKYGPVEILQPK